MAAIIAIIANIILGRLLLAEAFVNFIAMKVVLLIMR
jgi:hypothetical protein